MIIYYYRNVRSGTKSDHPLHMDHVKELKVRSRFGKKLGKWSGWKVSQERVKQMTGQKMYIYQVVSIVTNTFLNTLQSSLYSCSIRASVPWVYQVYEAEDRPRAALDLGRLLASVTWQKTWRGLAERRWHVTKYLTVGGNQLVSRDKIPNCDRLPIGITTKHLPAGVT